MDTKEYKERVDKLRRNYKDLEVRLTTMREKVNKFKKTLDDFKGKKPL